MRNRKRRLIVPRGSLADGEGPFAALDHLDAGRHGWRHLGALLVALFAHAAFGIAAATEHVTGAHPPQPPPRAPIQAVLEKAAPKPVAAAQPPSMPAARQRLPAARAPSLSRAPPAPAQAGKVIAQAQGAPADLTGFDLVVGEGKSYAGGVSAAKGTSTRAVEEAARIGGVPDAPQQDLSRSAAPLRRDWACAWPEEAQDSDLRDARVTVRVSVDKDGTPSQVEIVAAPPGGFDEAARRCAERELFRPALDARGRPLAAPTHLFNVHFLR